MLNEFAGRVADRLVRWYQDYHRDQMLSRLKQAGQRLQISPDVRIWGTHGVVLEDDVVINAFTHIFGAGGVRVGARSMISTGCNITSVTHPDELALRMTCIENPVNIGVDCWLGAGAIVLPGVTIGDGSIIAAGAVVTRDVPAGSVAVGVPARVVRAAKLD